VVAVSPSLRDELVRLDLCGGKQPLVLAGGSSNGVDARRIGAEVRAHDRAAERALLGVSGDQVLVAYIGRIRRDKGVVELSEAMRSERLAHTVLVTQGDIEDSSRAELDRLGARHIHLGWRGDVTRLLAAADVLVLPTHREGFPNVVLEAAAAGVPAVTTTATGAVDSVVDGETGLAVPPRDPVALEAAVAALAHDPERRRRMGARARQRALDEFSPEVIWAELDQLYRAPEAGAPVAVLPVPVASSRD
jgi:glycosyltransferase involved in cell wall biosynthesis